MAEAVRGVQQGCNLAFFTKIQGHLRYSKCSGLIPRCSNRERFRLSRNHVYYAASLLGCGGYSESHRMITGMPGGRRQLAEPQKVTGSVSERRRVRKSHGKSASGNEKHRVQGGSRRDYGCSVTSRNGTVQDKFTLGCGQWRASRACEGARPDEGCRAELSDLGSICRFQSVTNPAHGPTLHHIPSCSRLRCFGGVGFVIYHSL